MDIFDKLDKLIKISQHINESVEPEHDEEDYETEEGGRQMAMKQIYDRLLGDDKDSKGDGGGGTEMGEDDNPLSDVKKSKGGDGVDKTFRSSEIDDLDDLDSVDDDSEVSDKMSSLKDEDFEFDDFDYDDKKPSGGDSSDKTDGDDNVNPDGDSRDESDNDYDYEDGDFDDSELGDEDDYDFGDDSDDLTGDGKSGDESGDDLDDIDYDDTLDYDSKDYDSLESEIEDALDRTKENSSSKAEKNKLDDMNSIFSSGDVDGGGYPQEKANVLSKEIEKSLDDSSKTGSGELAGETLDKTPDNKSFEEDMEKAGFDKSDIDKMKKSKDTDTSENIDEEQVAKEAMEEMDKRAKSRGEESGSSLSRTIMRSVLKGKLSNMEWKEMVGIFLKSKSKTVGSSLSKSRSTSWGDKKHLWRDAILPKSTVSGGDVDEINCFIDFSGSVSQPLVFAFLQRVLQLCSKLSFGKVNVYGFAATLSEPFVIKKKDLSKNEDEVEAYLKDMWSFIYNQYLDGSIENFEKVAEMILKLKRKDHDTPILIFGDGLWATSYSNPKPPKYLKDLCSRYIKDILVLVYYDNDPFWKDILKSEVGYLKDIVGIKHIVTTEIEELK